MPIYNVTVPDVSPLVIYNGWWGDSSHDDAEWDKYVNGTFHATNAYGASASLTFNGSGVYIFGAKRPNHDQYSVALDGKTITGNGFSATDVFDQLLFSATDLDPSKEHQVAIQNAYVTSTESWVDVDHIEVTVGDNNATSRTVDSIWDDDHPRIQYSSGWDSSPNGFEGFYFGKTMHRTSVQGSSATIAFTGNAISVYGCTAANHGLFSVSLDHGEPLIMNGTAPEARYQLLLYYASGLSSTDHTLTITNVDTTGRFLDLDKVVLTTWPDSQIGTPGSIDPAQQSHAAHHMSTGPIVGIIVAVIVVAMLGVACVLLFLRRRGRQGVDRIRPSKESIVLGPEGTVVPYTSQLDLQSIEIQPLSGPASHHTDGGTMSYSTVSSSGQTHSYPADKKYIFSYSAQDVALEDNPRQDQPPPPDYTQAIASSHHG